MSGTAAGLALAMALGLAAAIIVAAGIGTMRRRGSVRRAALATLAASRGLPAPERLVAQATLLRRVVRTLQGEAAARERGDAWLMQLDRSFDTEFFTRGPGRGYAEDLYRPGPDIDAGRMDTELAALIRRIRA